MSIFQKIVLRGLKKNRARTIVTVIGVALATLLLTAITTFAVSLQAYMAQGAISKTGNWEVAFTDVDDSWIQKQQKNTAVTGTTAYDNIGYAKLEGCSNPDKPYAFIAAFDDSFYQTLPVQLISGRLPQNDQEIVIPMHLQTNGGIEYFIGDTITLQVGTRVSDGRTLSQKDAYQEGTEALTDTVQKTYQIVGICQRPPFESQTAPGYTFITVRNEAASGFSKTLFVTLKTPQKTQTYLKQIGTSQGYLLNDDVLRFYGLSDDKTFNMLLYSVAAVLIALIMIGSVFLIYNSFHMSLNERMQQYGILMSVGATEKQLRHSVLFEGFCVGCMGIPVGIAIGIPAVKLVLMLTEHNFSNILYADVPLKLHISGAALVVAVLISFLTILLSAWLPARKAVQTPIIECIRQTNEVQVSKKAVKISRVVESQLNLEGSLALKNFKRNRRRYRSVVLSLTLSVVLFVAANAFTGYLRQLSGSNTEVTDYDVGVSLPQADTDQILSLQQQMKNASGVTKSIAQINANIVCNVSADLLSDDYWQAIGQEKQTAGTGSLPMQIEILDDASYAEIAESLHLTQEETAAPIMVAKLMTDSDDAETVSDLPELFTEKHVPMLLSPEPSEEKQTIDTFDETATLQVTATDVVPPDTPPYTGTMEDHPYYVKILLPWTLKDKVLTWNISDSIQVQGLTFKSEQPSQTANEIKTILQDNNVTSGYSIYNVRKLMEQNQNMIFVINLFAGVFIVMMSLIAVANVFNTISTNIKLRRRELAMLRSVGMSDRNFNRMMRVECWFYGLRTMLFGIPLSIILSWLIYMGIDAGGGEIKYQVPLPSLGISLGSVLLIIFITMFYATGKLKKENIIDALRDDEL